MQINFSRMISTTAWTLLVGFTVAAAGCTSDGEPQGVTRAATYQVPVGDIREVMLASAEKNDRRFPTGEGRTLTTFAYIGAVDASDVLLRVVYCRAITNGMPSPRGSAWIAFFDNEGRWLKNRRINQANPPLWCGDGGIYFYGLQTVDGSGNFLDLTDGLDEAQLVQRASPGSWTDW